MATRPEDIKAQRGHLPARIRTVLVYSDGRRVVTDEVVLVQPYSGIAAGVYRRVDLDGGDDDE